MTLSVAATMNIDKRMKPVKRELYRVKFDTDFVLSNTVLPKNREDIPQIIGWSGPARSGTTAFLYLLASQPGVDRVYFQPQSTILRTAGPVFNISADDKVICLKEVFGGDPSSDIRTHDPIELLLKAGVPAAKITWVTMLREPVQAFGSLLQLEPDLTPEIAADTQKWALEIHERHKNSGVSMIPYVYELAHDNKEAALRALFKKIGLHFEPSSLKFDAGAISKKLVPGQLADPEYIEDSKLGDLDKTEYSFKARAYDAELPEDTIVKVKELCDEAYAQFREEARRELGL